MFNFFVEIIKPFLYNVNYQQGERNGAGNERK